MSKTVTSEQIQKKSENGEAGTVDNDVQKNQSAERQKHINWRGDLLNSRLKKLLPLSLAITIENIRDAGGENTVDALVSIFHRQQFSLAVFKGLVKWCHDCEVLLKDASIKTITFIDTVAAEMLKRNHFTTLIL